MLPFMLSPRSLLLGLFFMSHNYITDHLGSTRVVLNNAGSVLERYDYYPYGEKVPVTVANTGNTDYLYTGKESQNALFGINWYDSGARFQTTDGIFTSIDPLAEKYYHISPYAYCAGNPVNCVDLNGLNPIYSTKGDLLGTDDNGLQGEAIIMDSKNFTQGMSLEDALSYNLGKDGLDGQAALSRFNDSFNNLCNRPDWDGYLTLEEANDWYRNGNGQPLYVSLDKIDLSGIGSLGEHFVGQKRVMNLFFGSSSLNDALVYGNLTLKRYSNHSVRAFSDTYDFNMHSWWNPFNWARNVETLIGRTVAGQGTKYEINIYGSKQLRPFLPWIK